MRNLEEQPQRGSTVWMMALVVVTLGAKIDTITADCIMVGLTAYVVWRDSRTGKLK